LPWLDRVGSGGSILCPLRGSPVTLKGERLGDASGDRA
jgi:hypothetical protein